MAAGEGMEALPDLPAPCLTVVPRCNMQGTDVSEPETDGRVPETFVQLGMVLLGEDSFDAAAERVVGLAVQTLPSARFASITVSDRTGVRTSHSSGAEALAADQAQYEGEGGPCLEALRTSRQVDLVIAEAHQWPTFKSTAQAFGVSRVLSTPLIQRDTTLGALNIYTDGDGELSPTDRRIATLFAEQASVVLANAQAFLTATDMAKQLEQALASREIIGE
ncbi:MAG: hypothetical protein QOD63_289, partial [Actinomycetota bacterium]|nr:hypothetical protein [Actinomycetota bacterium]